jgi:hypothetical protein
MARRDTDVAINFATSNEGLRPSLCSGIALTMHCYTSIASVTNLVALACHASSLQYRRSQSPANANRRLRKPVQKYRGDELISNFLSSLN